MSEEQRVASNLVTSENLAEFAAQKLGLDQAKPETEAVQAEPEQAQQEPEEQAEQVERKPNPKIERRFSEITKQREQAKEEARREREARESLEARLKELEARLNPAPEPVDLNEEPKPEQFSDMYEYAKALAEHTAEKKLAERDQQELARKAAAEQEAKARTWAERVNAVKSEIADFEDMVQSSDVRVSDAVRDAIMESEHGPRILYYLADNSDVAKKLNAMSTVSAVREIGKIESRFERSESKPAVSKAPAPINPIRGALSTVDAGLDADGNFHGTYQQWKAARAAKKIR